MNIKLDSEWILTNIKDLAKAHQLYSAARSFEDTKSDIEQLQELMTYEMSRMNADTSTRFAQLGGKLDVALVLHKSARNHFLTLAKLLGYEVDED